MPVPVLPRAQNKRKAAKGDALGTSIAEACNDAQAAARAAERREKTTALLLATARRAADSSQSASQTSLADAREQAAEIAGLSRQVLAAHAPEAKKARRKDKARERHQKRKEQPAYPLVAATPAPADGDDDGDVPVALVVAQPARGAGKWTRAEESAAAEELVDLLQSEYGVAPADDAFQVLLRPSLATAEPMDEPGRAAESMLSSKVWGELHERIESRFTALGWPARNRLAIKTWAQSRYAFPGARKAWDNAANDQLRALKARGLDWPAIAEHMERPRQDCKSQYHSTERI